MLKLETVSKHFGSVRAIDEVSLSIAPGEMVGVIGPSGAGKSTLLRTINRLCDPTCGCLRCDGDDITAIRGRPLRQWRAGCAMIFQQFNLVDRLDVITNVLIGRLGHRPTLPTLAKHFDAAERAMAIHALDRLEMAPQALQRADTLSGGQQQRVAIARALVQEPRIVLADEPIASLDPRSAKRVMDALRSINTEDGLTVVCNLHDLETAGSYCDRIIGMSAGTVVFDGLPAELGAAEVRRIYHGADADEDRGTSAVGKSPAATTVAA